MIYNKNPEASRFVLNIKDGDQCPAGGVNAGYGVHDPPVEGLEDVSRTAFRAGGAIA